MCERCSTGGKKDTGSSTEADAAAWEKRRSATEREAYEDDRRDEAALE